MNIACSSCPAKYAVPDEKVRGRKVRITCKRCGAAIIVDGTAAGAASAATDPSMRPPQHTIAGGADAPGAGDAPAPRTASPAKASAPHADEQKALETAATAPGNRDAERDVATTAGNFGELAASIAASTASANASAASTTAAAEMAKGPDANASSITAPSMTAVSAPATAETGADKAKPFAAAKPLAGLGKVGGSENKAAAFPKPLTGTGKLAGLGKAAATPGKATTAAVATATPGKSLTVGGAAAGKAAPLIAATASASITAAATGTGATAGTTQAARAVVPRAAASAARAVAPNPLPERTWTVAVTDDDHHEMTLAQITDAYAAETIDAETFIWREGMQDWLAPFEIAEIATALRARKLSPRTNAGPGGTIDGEEPPAGAWREPGRWDRDEPSPPEEPNFDDVTVAMEGQKARALLQAVTSEEEAHAAAATASKSDGPTAIAPGVAEPNAVASPFAVTPELLGFGLDDAEGPVPKALAPVAIETRSESIVELAESLEREPDKLPFQLAPSAIPGRAAMKSGTNETDGAKPRDLFARGTGVDDSDGSFESKSDDGDDAKARTGARNESSVLFSLDQLAKPEPQPAAPSPKKRDETALLLGGTTAAADVAPVAGGLFGQTNMAAPDFTAPSPPSVPPGKRGGSSPPAGETKSSRGAGFWVGVLVALGVCGGGAYFLSRSPAPPPAPVVAERPAAVAPTAVQTAEPAATAPVPTASEAPAVSAEVPAASGTPADSASTPAGTPRAPSGAAASGTTAPAATGATAATPGTSTRTQPAAPKAPATAETPAANDGPEFDKDAAMAALATAGANAESQCASEEGTHGSGKVTVTFANSGRATNALVSGDFAGSALGGCVAKNFRSIHVPAFGGDPVRVSKTVKIP